MVLSSLKNENMKQINDNYFLPGLQVCLKINPKLSLVLCACLIQGAKQNFPYSSLFPLE